MTTKSNDNGRAFEFITLKTLQKAISKYRQAKIIENSSFIAAERAWGNVSEIIQHNCQKAAEASLVALFKAEPRLIEKDSDILTLQIQTDDKGKIGDVRDILIERNNLKWVIGLSIKHNHFAVKHSRLAKGLDFGNNWYGVPCSKKYWNAIQPIFIYLDECKNKKKKWCELPDKIENVYIPLLKAFINEIKNTYALDNQLPKKLAEYLLGKYDFYKIASVDAESCTHIQPYNVHKTLNKSSKTQKPLLKIPPQFLPTKIIKIEMKDNSNNTAIMYLDKGWTFSFRIHNASTMVETSLKFDIQFDGIPAFFITWKCEWIKN